MSFDREGYPLKFIQKDRCFDSSSHLFTLIYKFYSTVTKKAYVLRAEYHRENVFVVKFYLQQNSRSDFKYSLNSNLGDAPRILITCSSILPLLLSEYPDSSFAFVGARTWGGNKDWEEPLNENQRFRIYCGIVDRIVGDEVFEHFRSSKLSAYLLLNRASGEPSQRRSEIQRMFEKTYSDLEAL